MLVTLYRLCLYLLSFPLLLLLYIGGWKKAVLLENARYCGFRSPFFRLRFYAHVALDFLRLVLGNYGRPIHSRPQDAAKLKKLKSGSSLFLTAHFHHWELMGGWMVRQGVRLLSVARPLSQSQAQSLLLRLRGRLGLVTVSDQIPRRALRHLEAGGCFGMLWDQRSLGSPVRAGFFGRQLQVDPLPPFLLRHHSSEVWFGTLLPNGTFRLLLLMSPSSRGSRSVNPNRLARRYHRVLELLVRSHPTWWYGMAHRRFLGSLPLTSPSGVSRETSTSGQGWRA